MNEEKKTNLLVVFIPILLAIIILVIIPTGRSELKISQVSIIKEKGDYLISFIAINSTENRLQSKIEANVAYKLGHGKGGFSWETAGKKQFTICLEPKEEKQFRETMDLILPPKGIIPIFRELIPQIQILTISENLVQPQTSTDRKP